MFSDLSVVHIYVLDALMNVPLRIMYALSGIIILFLWSHLLTIVYLFFLCINVLIVLLTRKYRTKLVKRQKESEQGLMSKIQENFYNILLIKSAGIEEKRICRGKDEIHKYSLIDSRNTLHFSLLNIINGFSNNIWSIVLIVMGAFLVYDNCITVGEYIIFSILSSSISGIIFNLLDSIFKYPQACISFKRCEEYMGFKKSHIEGTEKFRLEKALTVNDLSFRYPGGAENVINNMSFILKPQSVVAVIGENGNGKTTLVNIITRLLNVEKSKIFIDNLDIKKINKTEFSRYVAYCTEVTQIFNASLAYNILLDREQVITDEDFKEILIQINLKDVIESLPYKMETLIGVGGIQLSAGNIQKIGIVRTLVTKPKIAVFDEPGTNLDIESKCNLYKLIKTYANDKKALVLVITHDKEFLPYADNIIYV